MARPPRSAANAAPIPSSPTALRPPAGSRTYQLFIELGRATRIRAGALGGLRLPAGRYVYTGSAKRGLAARVARHLRQDKRLRWHIDYLLAAPGARVVAVRYSRGAECALNAATAGSVVAPGFGSSDCRAGCGSHLKYLGREPRQNR